MTELHNANEKVTYTFRFTACNQCLQFTQNQLDRIPYLSALVTHKDDFLSIQNSNGEYLLNPPIHCTWFVAVLHSIFSEQAYSLFNELPEDENILDTLQLFDYLGVKSFNPPLLKDNYLVLSSPTNNNEEKCVTYHRANVKEARNTAAEFIMAISNNVYNLLDFHTVHNIFSLILTILSHADVFSSRFRHHTLTLMKECYWEFFSKKQQRELFTTHQMIEKHPKLNTFMYLYNNNNSLPNNFSGAFSWKGVYKPIEKKKDVDRQSTDGQWLAPFTIEIDNDYFTDYSRFWRLPRYEDISYRRFSDVWFSWRFLLRKYRPKFMREPNLWLQLRSSIGQSSLYQLPPVLRTRLTSLINKPDDDKELHIDQIKQEQKKNEAKSARSQRFNTLPKQANINKFKSRSGPKAQKYR